MWGRGSNRILWQIFSCPTPKRLIFPFEYSCHTCEKPIGRKCKGFISVLSIPLHWPICLSFCLFHPLFSIFQPGIKLAPPQRQARSLTHCATEGTTLFNYCSSEAGSMNPLTLSSFSRFIWLFWILCISMWILGSAYQFVQRGQLGFWQGLHWICRSTWRMLLFNTI